MGEHVLVGIDIGGTFSDVVALTENSRVLAAFKVPSTPSEPAAAVLTGLQRLSEQLAPSGLDVRMSMYHGTTVATNALIQKRGARTALVTTPGCRDVLALRRQARPDLYRLDQRISPPLVDRDDRLEVTERLASDGSVVEPLDEGSIDEVTERLAAVGVRSVAVCLLHSYANPTHERRVRELLQERLPSLDVSLSVDLCPELGEFERTSTTVVNAYVSPEVRGYLRELREGVSRFGVTDFSVVKSNGGLTSSTNAERLPLHLIESGPAAGLSGVAELGRQLGIANLVGFDMGGTTAKFGVISGGGPELARELYADRYLEGEDRGGYVVKSPVIDLAEIGAGGGSIAWLDDAGVLKVGPHSAGSDPGPACYCLGNDEPTVTDAHLVVGNLGASTEAVAGDLDVGRARDALRKCVAEPLGWTVEESAHAVLRLATATMAETVRLVTIRRGIDVRDFVLVAYGGAGPLHATDIAAEVGIATVVVPAYPAIFSAMGAVMCDVRHDLVQTLLRGLRSLDLDELAAVFTDLEARAHALLREESAYGASATPTLSRHLDLRHEGQLHQLSVPLPAEVTNEAIDAAFRAAYREHYGYLLPDNSVELVNARLEVVVPRGSGAAFPTGTVDDDVDMVTRNVVDKAGLRGDVPLVTRAEITEAGRVEGPVLVVDPGAVTPVRSGQYVRPLDAGAIAIERANDD